MSRKATITCLYPNSFNFIIPDVKSDNPLDKRKENWVNIILVVVSLVALSTWMLFTPPGIEGKAHAAGYSVCHQIESHSFTIGGKVLPLCARCTGTFLSLLITVLYLSTKGKRGAFPSKSKSLLLILFVTAFAVDGINSSLSLLPGLSPIYPPHNQLRLATGLLFGFSLGNLIVPLWNQTLWYATIDEPVLQNWKQFFTILFIVIVAGLLVIVNKPFLFYPIAIISTATIFLILGMIYSLLWCIIFKKENSLHLLRDGFRIFIAGLLTAILQVGLMDLLRYLMTGTWNSF